MAVGIGATLREARNRRKVDLPGVEEATKIRVRFLLAMENEEWAALPGGAYTRGFIRTYASYLGLDGARLAEEYRREVEGPAGERPIHAEPPVLARARSPLARISGPVWAVGVSLALVGLLIAIALLGGGGGHTSTPPVDERADAERQQANRAGEVERHSGVTVALRTKAEVWVCLLDGKGQPLVEGEVLEAGVREGPFNSGSFTVSLGNGDISMSIDGEPADIPATPSPIGYRIDPMGRLEELPEDERPTCT